jgi:hypothetical protein
LGVAPWKLLEADIALYSLHQPEHSSPAESDAEALSAPQKDGNDFILTVLDPGQHTLMARVRSNY